MHLYSLYDDIYDSKYLQKCAIKKCKNMQKICQNMPKYAYAILGLIKSGRSEINT